MPSCSSVSLLVCLLYHFDMCPQVCSRCATSLYHAHTVAVYYRSVEAASACKYANLSMLHSSHCLMFVVCLVTVLLYDGILSGMLSVLSVPKCFARFL